jgi:hypothetical protein
MKALDEGWQVGEVGQIEEIRGDKGNNKVFITDLNLRKNKSRGRDRG